MLGHKEGSNSLRIRLFPHTPPSFTGLVSLERRWQTFKEAFRDGVAQSLKLRWCVGHPLAIGRYQVFLVGEHPVETAAAAVEELEELHVLPVGLPPGGEALEQGRKHLRRGEELRFDHDERTHSPIAPFLVAFSHKA